jgi:hypothetical protein
MVNEELYLRNCIGDNNPFRVPEGYFENLTEQVMSRIPEEKAVEVPRKALVYRLRPVFYVAASVLLAVGSFFVYQNLPEEQDAQMQMAQMSDQLQNDFLDEAADYAMLDNTDIYACLMTE